jgi:hypothetical protein
MAGKATARRSAERADQEAAQEARISDLEQARQQDQAPPSVPGPRSEQAPAEQAAGGSDVFGQLSELVQMHDRGALTDEEFSAAKARLLG